MKRAGGITPPALFSIDLPAPAWRQYENLRAFFITAYAVKGKRVYDTRQLAALLFGCRKVLPSILAGQFEYGQ